MTLWTIKPEYTTWAQVLVQVQASRNLGTLFLTRFNESMEGSELC